MDMSLFKETLKRHSIRLKEDAIEAEFNDAIIKATYYSENAMAKVDNVIKTFKEKASNGCTDVLYAEGIKDIGRAIWSAIINFGKAIVRIAINIKMMFIGGEKGLIKRLAVIKDKVKDINGTIDAKLPVLKGKKGLGGFDDLITVLLDLASGDAYLSATLTPSGELAWNPNEKSVTKLERADALGQILSMSTFGKEYMDKIARRIKQDGSLVDVFAAPARVYNSIFTSDGTIPKTMASAVMGNDADIDAIDKYTTAVRSGVSKKGINAQLMKGIGSTDGKLKSAISYEDMKGLDKRTVITTIDNIATSIQTVFKASTKGDARKGIDTTLNFEDCMRVVIKDTTKAMKSLNKTGHIKDSAEAATRVQNISKASATVMNIVLRDYTNMAGDIKLILHGVVKQMSTGINESGKLSSRRAFGTVDDAYRLLNDPKSEFNKAIADGNMKLVRLIIKDTIEIDPTLDVFDAYCKVADGELNDLWDEHDGSVMESDKSKWNRTLLKWERTKLLGNFSKERVNFLKDLVKYITKSESNTAPIDNEYREGVFNRKKAMIIGTYHLYMTDEYKRVLRPLVDRIVKFAKTKGTEIRFEVKLPNPMVNEKLTDAFLYHSVEAVCTTAIGGFDTDASIKKLKPVSDNIERQTNKCIVDACAKFGICKDDAYGALDSFYTHATMSRVVELLKKQNLVELGAMMNSFVDIDNVIGRALAFADMNYYVDERPVDIISKYNALRAEMDELLLMRDRNWELPMTDRVLICVGYEHVDYIKSVYAEKGYTILT